ncbi:hypothetical protein [Coleofasciculus sp.]|uniref:hypothetical protein n=1 Tax=Coleofasciculus sp. TaxID=3100458 RepID=UPI003A174B48
MVDYSKWFTPNQKGKIQINSIAIYRDLSLEVVNKLDSNYIQYSNCSSWHCH